MRPKSYHCYNPRCHWPFVSMMDFSTNLCGQSGNEPQATFSHCPCLHFLTKDRRPSTKTSNVWASFTHLNNHTHNQRLSYQIFIPLNDIPLQPLCDNLAHVASPLKGTDAAIMLVSHSVCLFVSYFLGLRTLVRMSPLRHVLKMSVICNASWVSSMPKVSLSSHE